MGWLVKIRFPYHTLAIRLGQAVRPLCHDGLYIRSQYRTFALRIFRENLIFSLLSAYSTTPMANKGFLGPPNTDYNLHTKQQH